MAYQAHFAHADAIVAHLNGVVPTLGNPLLEAKYVGFITVAAVTVYELAIKEIFIEFAKKKHTAFGNFTEKFFERLNGRIKTKELRENYIKGFGEKYVLRFDKQLEKEAKAYLTLHKRDIRSSYGNIITWRHDFAHAGKINANATYSEAALAYEEGKVVIHCLAQVMIR
jgi:RiboL-PSP-HEPN